ncbi:hypothetical protein KGY79_01715 [Candidatus Bipolaricaulota bacterium]|nr:hypothetical protein [Candidatus Bipolaricaulota bacterium]
MNRNYTLGLVFFLVTLLVFNLVGVNSVLGEEKIRTTDKFIERLEEEYRKIENFSARLAISGLEPPLKVEVRAISEPRVLRVEYLSPPEMQGQFFLLKEDFLYQFMPAQNLVIEKDLKKSNMPVKAANLTPDYLLEIVRSDELDVNLISGPGEIYFPWDKENVLDFETSVSWLENEDSSNSLYDPDSTTPVSFDFGEDDYVLEAVPLEEGYRFSRQVIKFDPDNLLPRELITYFEDEEKGPVTTEVEEVSINLKLVLDEITKLPEDAEVISD